MRMSLGIRVATIAASVAALALPAVASAYKVEDNQVITSFDGTPIVYSLTLPQDATAQHPVPVLLLTHGWGGARLTPENTPGMAMALDRGYAVLSSDSRGFGQSGGQVEIDSYDYEARDESALIDVVAKDPRIARTPSGDPRVGMFGNSYAGGIQWVTAARDPRVLAIAPGWSWHNLVDSLSPAGQIRTTWLALLYGLGFTAYSGGVTPGGPAGTQTGGENPMIHEAAVEAYGAGAWESSVQQFFTSRGPWDVLDKVTAPTLIINATTDVLFPTQQAVDNYDALKAAHPTQPLKMIWPCGGHGTCNGLGDPENGSSANFVENRTLQWFDRYVKGDTSVDTGAKFEYLQQDGDWRGASEYPVPGTVSATGSGSGIVTSNGEPQPGGASTNATSAHSPPSVEIPIDIKGSDGKAADATLVGQPVVTLTELGGGVSANNTITSARPATSTLYFQLVDKTSGLVMGNQVTPYVVDTDGAEHSYTIPLANVAFRVPAGDKIALQILGTDANFVVARGGGIVNLTAINVSVPALLGADSSPPEPGPPPPPSPANAFNGFAAAEWVPGSSTGALNALSPIIPCQNTMPAGGTGGKDVATCDSSSPHTLPASLGTISDFQSVVNGAASNGVQTSHAHTYTASVSLLPYGVPASACNGGLPCDLLDATHLDADATTTCARATATATVGHLSIAGYTVDVNQGANTPIEVGPSGNPIAEVTVGQQSSDNTNHTATASALKVTFPATSPLATLTTGTIYLTYAQAGLGDCPV